MSDVVTGYREGFKRRLAVHEEALEQLKGRPLRMVLAVCDADGRPTSRSVQRGEDG